MDSPPRSPTVFRKLNPLIDEVISWRKSGGRSAETSEYVRGVQEIRALQSSNSKIRRTLVAHYEKHSCEKTPRQKLSSATRAPFSSTWAEPSSRSSTTTMTHTKRTSISSSPSRVGPAVDLKHLTPELEERRQEKLAGTMAILDRLHTPKTPNSPDKTLALLEETIRERDEALREAAELRAKLKDEEETTARELWREEEVEEVKPTATMQTDEEPRTSELLSKLQEYDRGIKALELRLATQAGAAEAQHEASQRHIDDRERHITLLEDNVREQQREQREAEPLRPTTKRGYSAMVMWPVVFGLACVLATRPDDTTFRLTH